MIQPVGVLCRPANLQDNSYHIVLLLEQTASLSPLSQLPSLFLTVLCLSGLLISPLFYANNTPLKHSYLKMIQSTDKWKLKNIIPQTMQRSLTTCRKQLCMKIYLHKVSNRSVSKFTNGEKSLVKNIVANLTIKRIAEEDIIKVIFDQTGKSITRKEIWNIRERIKRSHIICTKLCATVNTNTSTNLENG